MEFCEIRDEVKKMSIEALRSDKTDYFEAVIIKEELGKINERLKIFFGEPASDSKSSLPREVQDKIDGFGGINPGQTLYLRNEGSDSIFAMLWPWQDGKRTTLKIIHK